MSKDKYRSILSNSNGGFCVYYPSNIFRNTRSFEDINNSLHLARNYTRIFVHGHYLFREHSSRKPVYFEEQIMSKDKYPSLFSPQMEAIVPVRGKCLDG